MQPSLNAQAGRAAETLLPIWPIKLLTDSKFLDNALVAFGIVLLQIIEQAAALAYHHEQTTPGGMVFFVGFEVLRQVADPFAKYGNLDFRAASIRLMRAEAVNDLGLLFSR